MSISLSFFPTRHAFASADPPPLTCMPPRRDSCVERSKKDPHAGRIAPVLRPTLATLMYLHTHEAIVLGDAPASDEPELLSRLLRDRTSWEPHEIAPGCLVTLRAACVALGARRVEVVSGFRSDKLNEMLRKKGRQVARRSQHTEGNAVDFRLVGVESPELFRFVRRTHRGGVGVYPGSNFVHVDVGPERRWRGE